MSYEHILLDVTEYVATLTLNQPDSLNAMSPEMGQEIRAVVDELNQRDDVRVVVVRGAGRAFSAGGNLDRLEEEAQAARGEKTGQGIGGGRSFYSLYLSVRELRAPSIAAINGHAIGAGLCFALGCDMRIVHEKAKLGMTFVRVGIHPGMAATWNLPRLVGPAMAAELLYSGRLVTADEAARIGLANRAASADAFDGVVDELAEQIAGSAPVAVRAVKETLRGTYDRTIEDAIGLEADQQAMTFTTTDSLEGIAAIREKRAPRFEGR